MTDDNVRATWPITAGMLVRKQAIYQLQSTAMQYGIHFSYVENRGWLESEYTISVDGPRNKVQAYIDAVKEWSESIQ